MYAGWRTPSSGARLMTRSDTYLGLGSNVGERASNLGAALSALAKHLDIVRVSSVYETEPVGFDNQSPFLNLVCHATTVMSPRQLLKLTQSVEAQVGRLPTFRNGPRVIDIDILLFDSLCLRTERLVIPHPELPNRLFALVPLAEIAPDFVHPVLHKSIRQLLLDSTDRHWVRAMTGGKDVPAIR